MSNSKEKKRNGFAEHTYPNGNKYIGEFRDNKYHGQGTFTYADGAEYTGEWKNDKRNGKGTSTFSSGEHYTGEWKNDKRNGKGTLTFSSGKQYIGEFKDNKYHGQGTFTYADGTQYTGKWINHRRNGKGTLTFSSGEQYIGEFKDNKRDGHGKAIYETGNIYIGEWKDDKRHGLGALNTPDGIVYEGEWKNNKQHFEGTFAFDTGGGQDIDLVSALFPAGSSFLTSYEHRGAAEILKLAEQKELISLNEISSDKSLLEKLVKPFLEDNDYRGSFDPSDNIWKLDNFEPAGFVISGIEVTIFIKGDPHPLLLTFSDDPLAFGDSELDDCLYSGPNYNNNIFFKIVNADPLILHLAPESGENTSGFLYGFQKQTGKATNLEVYETTIHETIIHIVDDLALWWEMSALEEEKAPELDDYNFMIEKVKMWGESFGYASKKIQKQKSFVLATVKQKGAMLSQVSEEFRADREIVLAAVRENAEAIKYAGNELKNDPEINEAALNNLKNRFGIIENVEIHLKKLIKQKE